MKRAIVKAMIFEPSAHIPYHTFIIIHSWNQEVCYLQMYSSFLDCKKSVKNWLQMTATLLLIYFIGESLEVDIGCIYERYNLFQGFRVDVTS